MILRIVRLPLLPERAAEFLALFGQSENHIRQQPGCHHLELWQDADHPHTYCTYSHWVDVDALNTYRKSALFGEIWPTIKSLLAAPPQAFSVMQATERG
ncbi:MAG: putative quinol monooxygenase [Janthinobacterium lividum]